MKSMLKKMWPIIFLCSVWALVTVTLWFWVKVFGAAGKEKSLFASLGNADFFLDFFLVFWGVLVMWWIRRRVLRRGLSEWVFRANFVRFFWIFVIVSWMTFFYPYIWIFPVAHIPEMPFPMPTFLFAQLSFFFKFGISVLWVLSLALTMYICGSGIFRVFLKRANIFSEEIGALRVFLKFGLGFFGVTTVFFALAFFGILTRELVVLFFVVTWVIGRRSFVDVVKSLLKRRSFSLPVKRFEPLLLLLLSVLLVVASFLFSIRTFPVKFDDATQYLNRARVMGESGALVGGGTPFPVELIFAAGYALSHNAQLAVASLFVAFLLTAGAVFFFTRRFFGMISAVIALIAWFSTLQIWYLVSIEAKPDLFLCFLAVLAVWLIAEWIHTKHRSFLFASAFLLGCAVTVKLTALFLVVSVGLAVLIVWLWRWNVKFLVREWSTILIAGFLFCFPIAIWTAYGISTKTSFANENIVSLLFSSRATDFYLGEWSAPGDETIKACASTGVKEDFGRYMNTGGGWRDYTFLLWDVTMNSRLGFFGLEIGFLYLATFPLIVVWSLMPHGKQATSPDKKNTEYTSITVARLLVFIVTVYVGLWIFLAKGVVWYGVSGLVALSVLIGASWIFFQKTEFLKKLFCGLLAISVGMNFLVAYRELNIGHSIFYLGGMTSDEVLDMRFPYFAEIIDIVNKEKDARIYSTGNPLFYFIDDNSRRVFFDVFLDTFICIDQGGEDDEKTLERLRRLNFRYFIYVKDSGMEDGFQNMDTLQRKKARFETFAEKNLSVLVSNKQILLFELR